MTVQINVCLLNNFILRKKQKKTLVTFFFTKTSASASTSLPSWLLSHVTVHESYHLDIVIHPSFSLTFTYLFLCPRIVCNYQQVSRESFRPVAGVIIRHCLSIGCWIKEPVVGVPYLRPSLNFTQKNLSFFLRTQSPIFFYYGPEKSIKLHSIRWMGSWKGCRLAKRWVFL